MTKRLRSTEYPIGHILNPLTPYVSAAKTDLRQTFDRIRELQKMERDRQEHATVDRIIARTTNVQRLK
jgi:hypothetical protein